MSQGFELQCDRLSQAVDGAQFERLRWARNEGPMLAKLVGLAHAAFEGRSEFELADEASTNEIKRFVLKVHNQRVAAIAIFLERGQVKLQVEEIERSQYRIREGLPLAADFEQIDEAWMASALQELFGRIQAQ